jgi:hypothetical protein
VCVDRGRGRDCCSEGLEQNVRVSVEDLRAVVVVIVDKERKRALTMIPLLVYCHDFI